MRYTECRFVTRPSDILFACVYVNTFQPGNLTGLGSEGVKFNETAIHLHVLTIALRFFCETLVGSLVRSFAGSDPWLSPA